MLTNYSFMDDKYDDGCSWRKVDDGIGLWMTLSVGICVGYLRQGRTPFSDT